MADKMPFLGLGTCQLLGKNTNRAGSVAEATVTTLQALVNQQIDSFTPFVG